MSDYTPKVEDVRACYCRCRVSTERDISADLRKGHAEFDRFIAKVKADALREALSDIGDQADEPTVIVGEEEDESTWVDLTLREWLTIRADRIEGKA